MSRLFIVVEKASDWGSFYPSDNVITAVDYLKQPIATGEEERTQVINLCRSYKYLGLGYYVSLLAEARGHRVIPSVRTINDLRRRSIYGLDIEDLNQKLTRFLPAEGRDTTEFDLLVYFGTTSYAPLADLARQVFDIFPCPILQARVRAAEGLADQCDQAWQPAFADRRAGRRLRAGAGIIQQEAVAHAGASARKYRYDIAMLRRPQRGDAAVEQARAQALHARPARNSASRSTRSSATTTSGWPNTTPCSSARPPASTTTPTASRSRRRTKTWW